MVASPMLPFETKHVEVSPRSCREIMVGCEAEA
jgi:hypothetical protein